MPRRTPATPFLDALARRLATQDAAQTPDPQPAGITGALSDTGNTRTAIPEPTVGTLVYLSSFGAVATTIVVVFFGIGFFLLSHTSEEMTAGSVVRGGGVEVERQRTDLLPSPDAGAPSLQPTMPSAHPVPPAQTAEAHEIRAPENGDTTWGLPPAPIADKVAASASGAFDREVPASTGAAAVLTPRAEISHAKAADIGRHHFGGTAKHRVVVSRPGAIGRAPPAVSGPERIWRWIVRSTNNVVASLAPPPLPQASGLKTR